MDISENNTAQDSLIDTTNASLPKEVRPDRTIPELYYQLADLEAFTFDRYEQSISYLEKIIDEFPESKFKSKSMFALVFVYEALNDSVSAEQIKLNLIKNFPNSEYTSYLTGEGGITESNEQKIIFKEAESEMFHDKKKGIDLLKSVIQIDSVTNTINPKLNYPYRRSCPLPQPERCRMSFVLSQSQLFVNCDRQMVKEKANGSKWAVGLARRDTKRVEYYTVV